MIHKPIIPDHTRVRQISLSDKHGVIAPQTIDGFYRVKWDDRTVTHEAPDQIEPIPASS